MGYRQLTALTEKPWEQQPGENAKHFQLFEIYRDDPELSHAKLSQKCGKSISVINKVSLANKWQERRTAWTAHQGEIRIRAKEKAIADMRERHIKVAMAMQAKGLKALELQNPATMKSTDIRQILIDGAKLEMLSRGEPTEKTENKTEINGGLPVIIVDDLGDGDE